MRNKLLIFALIALFMGCASQSPQEEQKGINIEYEKFELDNGLDVVFHVDRSDPVVAVTLTAHVGSAREKTGRTGFAHLFEHLLFLESENLGKGGLDKMSARIGGSGANGSTSRDRTNYYQTVPKDALEKMIWAEADKLGWFINTVTEPVLAKEKQVVKNEKRQSVDNRPYGHTNYVIGKALYPEGHPYNWQVIGSLEDLQNATLADVKEFFKKWYVPNNTTLVVSGDFDPVQAKAWVKKYFDEIKRGEEVQPLEKQPVVVAETVKLYHEDNFARLPELTLAWPTVELYHPDSYALDILCEYLSDGKAAPFNKVLVEDKQLTSNVSMYNWSSELAGELHLSVRAFGDKDLDEALVAVEEAFAKFEKEGISDKDLSRIKAQNEAQFYNRLSSVLGKGFQLAQYNIFADDPGFINRDIENLLKVSKEDVMRVYNTYVKGKNYIATSFVPKGKVEQALEGSEMAAVVEEKIEMGAEEEVDPTASAEYERTPSTFDRTVEPEYGAPIETPVPAVWETKLANGMRVYGIENNEVPLVEFNIVIDGGLLLENMDKVGVANLLADMMTKGTKSKTPAELEAAIAQLGASIYVYAGSDDITVSASTLAKNYEATLALVKEVLLEPRWDEGEFELAVQAVKSSLQQQEASPNSIAQNYYDLLVYGEGNIRSKNPLGTVESVSAITLEDLKSYYAKNLSPSVSRMHIVGAIKQAEAVKALASLEKEWASKEVAFREYPEPAAPEEAKVYFYDVPNAKQSVLRIGYPALAVTHPDFNAATIANYKLGGGGFASQLTQQLREGKGYTYGIRSRFYESKDKAPFTISSGVRSNVTLESVQLIKEILENYGKGFSEEDLATTKSYFIKSNARAFETTRAKLSMLEDISAYGWSYDYVKKKEDVVKAMTVERIQELSAQYLDPNRMVWLIVGDAKTQLGRLDALGYGKPVLLNEQAK